MEKTLLNQSYLKRTVPGLRDVAPNGKCVCYKLVDGKKTEVKKIE